ncbi:MAG: hypothetical protein H6650_18410 [Ardenticatenales bacterium]|nr:hypothetical protein [Ardenticatenales bacterium]
MNKPLRTYLTVFTLIAIVSGLYWLLPISGKLAYIPDSLPQTNTWPQISVVNKTDNELEIIVQDVTPWVFVRLELAGTEITLTEHGSQNEDGIWQWQWLVRGTPDSTTINLYHNCDTGCQLWTKAETAVATPIPNPNELIPTKLGLVFANPERDWHDRQGWDIEITYSQLAEEQFWGIDDLVQRVQQANKNGLRVLVRVEYDQGQSIPPPDAQVALDSYLRYLRRLARDERLADIHGFIIGSNFNTVGANAQSPENPVTPEWYARVFNGYGADPTIHNNAIEVIRNENEQARVIVGPVNPWNSDQTGEVAYQIDVPWLNYMNSVVIYINTAASAKIERGISDTAPDGYAVQAFGRVDAPELSPEQRAQEPFIDLRRDEWGEAQAGFRVYQDWLDIINQYEYTSGKPVYINASNTFDSEKGRFPAENYPEDWLSNALEAINQEPQIRMLGWFMDGFPHDEQWAMFSLTTPRGLLIEASQEFDALLLEK